MNFFKHKLNMSKAQFLSNTLVFALESKLNLYRKAPFNFNAYNTLYRICCRVKYRTVLYIKPIILNINPRIIF